MNDTLQRGRATMRYRLSCVIPVRMQTACVAVISGQEMDEWGHGNHFVSGPHADAELSSWWQWRGRIFRQQTLRTCLSPPA